MHPAIEHGDPKDAPTRDAEDRNQIHEPLGRPQLCFLRLAAGFEDLVERLDLPSLRLPFELLDRVKARAHRQIRERLPVDLLAALRLALFSCINRSEDQCISASLSTESVIAFKVPILGRGFGLRNPGLV
jgi:hypothetical protein